MKQRESERVRERERESEIQRHTQRERESLQFKCHCTWCDRLEALDAAYVSNRGCDQIFPCLNILPLMVPVGHGLCSVLIRDIHTTCKTSDK